MRSAPSPSPSAGVREAEPGRRVGVLATVLAHAGRVGARCSRGRAGDCRRAAEAGARAARLPRTSWRPAAWSAARVLAGSAVAFVSGQDRPRLRDGVDAALAALRRADRRAVVVEGAQVPRPVPGDASIFAPQRGGALDATARRRRASRLRSRERGEALHRRAEEPAEPDALAPPLRRRPGSCRRSSRRRPSAGDRARPAVERALERPAAVLEAASAACADARELRVAVVLVAAAAARPRGRAPARRGSTVSPVAATYSPVTKGSQSRSSEQRVRTPRPEGGCHQCSTSPCSNWWAAASSRCARAIAGRRVEQGQHVLQLVAEAERAARLVEARAAEDARREALVEQPAVEHQVHRAARASSPAPRQQPSQYSRSALQAALHLGPLAEARHQLRARLRGSSPGRG